MKEIRLGTAEDMVEGFIEYLRKKWQWLEKWVGVHHGITGIIVGFIAYMMIYPERIPPDIIYVIAL